MILNGLGFVSKPLYMFPQYFETIACEHLIGAGVKPEYLNDDKLGRVMDKLFIKGLDTIFFIIALKAAQKFGVSLSSSHLDSSSIHVHGEYNTSLPEDSRKRFYSASFTRRLSSLLSTTHLIFLSINLISVRIMSYFI
jgi:transposase